MQRGYYVGIFKRTLSDGKDPETQSSWVETEVDSAKTAPAAMEIVDELNKQRSTSLYYFARQVFL